MDREGTAPVLKPGHTYASVTDKISSIVLARRMPFVWWVGFAISFLLLMVLLLAVTVLFIRGTGIWGINIPVAWGFAIINFVWWIGIGHAGTLISAILLLLRQDWRNSINRFAEAMTLFAVANAALFPFIHLGRARYAYYMVPYPNTMDLWPQFRSPLVWDLFAVFTYGLVSLGFWYLGLVPDLATLRDRSSTRFGQRVYAALALGWRGSARHWRDYQKAYFLIAALATPLVVSVHSIVGLDFATSLIPGWHTTVFPPYFVAGAVLSGFAMVLTLTIPLRAVFNLEDFITLRHLDNMAKIILATSLLVAYGYIIENFMALYTGDIFEVSTAFDRFSGYYAVLYWGLIGLNVFLPQLFWFKRLRTSVPVLFVVSILINIGMWLERFVIVVLPLYHDYLPSAWQIYTPTGWDWATFLGTLGLFFALIFLFIRFLPVISIFETRELVAEQIGEDYLKEG